MQYDMVFEGGGAKGMVFVGALEVFFNQGHTAGRVMGTSAGAITASMLAAGYTPPEMLEALAETRDGKPVFAEFMSVPDPLDRSTIQNSATRALLRDLNLPFIPDQLEEKLDNALVAWMVEQPALRSLFSFIERGGWYSADHFLEWLRRRLDTGENHGKPRHYSNMTLAQFYDATQVDLTLIGSDTTGGDMLILNHRTAPDLPLAWAVRMSMSVPLLWQEVVWQSDWGTYRGKSMDGHAIVDGGLLSNFPIELFISKEGMVTSVMGPKTSDRVLGLLIDESLPVEGTAAAAPVTGFSISKLATVQRLSNLMNTTLSARDKLVIDNFAHLVVRLPAKGYGTTEFHMTPERRQLLVQAGRTTMTAYLEAAFVPGTLGGFGTLSAEDQAAQNTADRLAQKLLSK